MAINPYMNVTDPGYYQSLSFEDISRVAEAKTTQHVQQDQLLNTLYAKDPVTDDDKAKYLEATQGYNTAVDQAVSDLANKGVSRGTFAQVMSLRDKNRTLYDSNYGQLTGYVNKYKAQQDSLAEMTKMKGWSDDPEGLAMARKYILGQTPAALDENGIPRQVAYDLPPEYIDVSNYIDERLKNTGDIQSLAGTLGELKIGPNGQLLAIDKQGAVMTNAGNLLSAVNGLYTELLDPESALGKFYRFRFGNMDENTIVQIINQRANALQKYTETSPTLDVTNPRGSKGSSGETTTTPKQEVFNPPPTVTVAPGKTLQTPGEEQYKVDLTVATAKNPDGSFVVPDQNVASMPIPQQLAVAEARANTKSNPKAVEEDKQNRVVRSTEFIKKNSVYDADSFGAFFGVPSWSYDRGNYSQQQPIIEQNITEALNHYAENLTLFKNEQEAKDWYNSTYSPGVTEQTKGVYGKYAVAKLSDGTYVGLSRKKDGGVSISKIDDIENNPYSKVRNYFTYVEAPSIKDSAIVSTIAKSPVQIETTDMALSLVGENNRNLQNAVSVIKTYDTKSLLPVITNINFNGEDLKFEGEDIEVDKEVAASTLKSLDINGMRFNDGAGGMTDPSLTIQGVYTDASTNTKKNASFTFNLMHNKIQGMNFVTDGIIEAFEKELQEALASSNGTESQRVQLENALKFIKNIKDAQVTVPGLDKKVGAVPTVPSTINYNMFEKGSGITPSKETDDYLDIEDGAKIISGNPGGVAKGAIVMVKTPNTKWTDPQKMSYGYSLGYDETMEEHKLMSFEDIHKVVRQDPSIIFGENKNPDAYAFYEKHFQTLTGTSFSMVQALAEQKAQTDLMETYNAYLNNTISKEQYIDAYNRKVDELIEQEVETRLSGINLKKYIISSPARGEFTKEVLFFLKALGENQD